MPSKKKKYNTRFPASRIKKIMQTDEEIGKVAQAVPIIISRTLELFVESLLRQSMQITQSRNAKTLTPSHMKQCILAESRFDFLKDLVKNVPDASIQEDNENNALDNAEALDYSIAKEDVKSIPELPAANYYTEQLPSNSNTSIARTPVIHFNPKYTDPSASANDQTPSAKTYPSTHQSPQQTIGTAPPKINFSIDHLVSSSGRYTSNNKSVISSANNETDTITPHLHLDFSHMAAIPMVMGAGATTPLPSVDVSNNNCSPQQMTNHIIAASPSSSSSYTKINDDSGNSLAGSASFNFPIPPLPLPQSYAIPPQNTSDSLYIDEDYDN